MAAAEAALREGAGGAAGVWLAVETSTAVGSVAIWRGGLSFEQSFRIQGTHSERVLPAIDYALKATETDPALVTDFVVGSGPGSFTGVRISASLAKGWAMARRTPLFAYSSLLAVAAGCRTTGQVCALFDARRGEVYAACYEMGVSGPVECLAPGAWPVPQLLAELEARGLRPSFAGEGARRYAEQIESGWPEAEVLPEHLGVPRAASLLWLRQRCPELGRVPDSEGWQPLYVRDWRVPDAGGAA